MIKKKDLPLKILKTLEPFVHLTGDKFKTVEPKGVLLHVLDIDDTSDFYFKIENYQLKPNGTYNVLIDKKPKSERENGNHRTWVEIKLLEDQFKSWVTLLEQYENVKSFYDDPITKSFQEEFYTEFEIIDEDAETNPLKTTQILMLDSYLEAVGNKLTEFTTETNSYEIEDIKSDINQLRENLTTKSKKWVVNELTTIWAKMAKQGTKFIREFLTESKKELIKEGIKGLLKYAIENSQDLMS